MTSPLIPANVDLTDFDFMPFEFGRLFSSETWVLSNDAEKVAALTLWGKSWHEEPAGSLPNDDRMLAHLSGAGTRWKRLKTMALRGWIQADDDRLYHPVVCEKALEAWLEKLHQRLSSGAGNAKRWGIDFDPSDIEAEIAEARRLLTALNPQSRQLTKRKPPGVPTGPKPPPDGNRGGIPPGIPTGSQGTRTRTVVPDRSTRPTREARPPADFEGAFEGHEQPTTAPKNPAVPLAVALNGIGVRCTAMNPDLVAYAAEGGTPEHLLDVASHPDCTGKPATYIARFARRELTEAAAPVATGPPRNGAAPSKSAQALSALEALKTHDPLAPQHDRDRPAKAAPALAGPNPGR